MGIEQDLIDDMYMPGIHLGDCLDLMSNIPDESVDMVLADPPYGTTKCKWDSIIPLAEMWAELKRIITPGHAIVMTASQPFTSCLVMSNPGWFRYSWVWDKRFGANFGVAKIQPIKRHEDIVVFSEKKCPPYYPQMMKRDKPIRIGKNSSNSSKRGMLTKNALNNPAYDGKVYSLKYPESIQLFNVREGGKHLHPTQKPVDLLEYLIKTYTKRGQMVLDFAMGSGTTGVACRNTGRRFIGIEKDPAIYEIARSRLSYI